VENKLKIMKKLAIVLFAMLLVCPSCEKETVDPPQQHEALLGLWHMYHEVNGEISNTWDFNGNLASYELTLHSLERGEVEVLANGFHYRTYKFFVEILDDSLHISYDCWNHAVPPMLPAFGWHKYLQYEMEGQEILLIGYQFYHR
jgi:hypothetical protein